MRLVGRRWLDIAGELGYASPGAAYNAVHGQGYRMRGLDLVRCGA